MKARSWDDYVRFDSNGTILRLGAMDNSFRGADAPPAGELDDEAFGTPVPVGGGVSGVSDFTGDTDVYSVTLVAGQTYTFSLQGSGPIPLSDTYLELFTGGGGFINADDDGGIGTASILTYTATESGTYFLRARAFANPGDPGIGGYSLDVRQMGADNVGNTNATAGSLAVGGQVISFIETGTDVDRYAITLEAGKYYTFQVAGGADYETNYLAVPTGELDTILRIRSADGTILAENDDNNFPSDISSGVGFYATTSGTYYIEVDPYSGQTGGYVLQSNAPLDPTSFDPLESLNWDSANNIPVVMVNGVPTAYVYFASAAEGGFGEVENGTTTPITTYGWEQFQINGVMSALQEYTPITGINYVRALDVNQATFRLVTTINDDYGARFYPQAPSSGSKAGLGIFNLESGGFGSDPASLQPGGFSYAVILHEFGHAHGVAHPHDQGGGSEIMLGVTGASALGVFDLNQGVYTVMSYNDGWQTHPDGTRNYSTATRGDGWSETLGAFDIAVLQARYGTHANNVGDTVYTLADTQATAQYRTIWDTGGKDTIAYSGNRDVQIDLLAATLDYSPTGGGVVSYASGIWGGYTIANDVVIENATGGSGNDLLLGNSDSNVLTGSAGNDKLAGRGGIDVYTLGAGADEVIAFLGEPFQAKRGPLSYDIVTDFDGTSDKIDFRDLDADAGISGDQAFAWIGTKASKGAGELSYKVYDSVNGAEKSLGIEIDDFTGAYIGKVTVVMANVDGGAIDYAIVLLGTPSLSASDFML
jgi:hypothetical protein